MGGTHTRTKAPQPPKPWDQIAPARPQYDNGGSGGKKPFTDQKAKETCLYSVQWDEPLASGAELADGHPSGDHWARLTAQVSLATRALANKV